MVEEVEEAGLGVVAPGVVEMAVVAAEAVVRVAPRVAAVEGTGCSQVLMVVARAEAVAAAAEPEAEVVVVVVTEGEVVVAEEKVEVAQVKVHWEVA